MHPILARQLKRLGLSAEDGPSDGQVWQALLERVERAYSQMDQDRYLLERSLDISSKEMQAANVALRQAHADLELKHRELERANEVFRTTMEHMLEAVQRGATQPELLVYLRHVQSEFERV